MKHSSPDFSLLNDTIRETISPQRNLDFFELLYFHIKRYFTSFTTLFLYVVPLLFIFAVATIVPTFIITSGIFSSSLIVSCFFVFGVSFFRIKESSFIRYHNIKLQNLYFSSLIIVFISNFLIFIYILLVIFLLLKAGIIYNYWFENIVFNNVSIIIDWNSINWLLVFYFWLSTTIFAFLVVIIISLISKKQFHYYFATVFILIYTFAFGGVLNMWYYPIPWFNPGSYYDPVSDNIIIYPKLYVDEFKAIFALSLISPFWYINTLGRYMFVKMTMVYISPGNYLDILIHNPSLIGSSYLNQNVVIDYFNFHNFLWALVLFGPFAITGLYVLIIEMFFVKKQIVFFKLLYNLN